MTASRLAAAALFSLALLASGCAQETIAHQQVEREANRIVKLLKDRGIEATKLKDAESRELRFNVMVPQDSSHDALRILEEFNLPETPKMSTAEIVSSGSSMIPTTEQERSKRIVGVEGDVVNALRRIPRVIDAQALVSIPADDPLRDPNEARPRPKASVLVVYRTEGGQEGPPITVEHVQEMAAGKLSELKANEVTVLLIPHDGKSGGGGGGQSAGAAAAAYIDPAKGCQEKEVVIGIEVCAGNKRKVVNLVLTAVIVAGVLAGMAVVAVLRAMRYRKDLTRLTAQFQNVRK